MHSSIDMQINRIYRFLLTPSCICSVKVQNNCLHKVQCNMHVHRSEIFVTYTRGYNLPDQKFSDFNSHVFSSGLECYIYRISYAPFITSPRCFLKFRDYLIRRNFIYYDLILQYKLYCITLISLSQLLTFIFQSFKFNVQY